MSSINYRKPVLARGALNIVSSTGTYSDGESTFTETGDFGSYSVDDLIFATKSDGTLLEFLGKATAASSNSITTKYSLSRGFSSDTLLIWRADKSFFPDRGISDTLSKIDRTGTVTLNAIGG
jgi:hypothetical protein